MATPTGLMTSSKKYKVKVVDDTLLWDKTLEGSFFKACQFLDTCGRNGIILNPKKFQFAEDSVQFVGFEVGKDSVKPGEKYYAAITEFPRPTTLTEIRSFFGLVEQVAYTFYASQVMAPFRELLKPANSNNGKIYWDDELDKIFQESKHKIIEAMEEGVKMFDMKLPVAVSTDYSKTGLGNSLFQKHCPCPGENPNCCKTGWKLVAFSSRFTHPAEKNYSPVEGEALSAAVGLKKFRHFILGCDKVMLAIDHKPLLKLFGDRRLEDIENERLRKLKEKTFPYKFRVVHVPGKLHKTADTGSRYPHDPPELFLEDEILGSIAEEVEIELHAEIMENLNDAVGTVSWKMVQEATNADERMCRLREIIKLGETDARTLPDDLKEYARFMGSLYVQDDVILYGSRTVVPARLRSRVIETLHSAHQGCTQMGSRAETAVFWPGISGDIEDRRGNCNTCRTVAPSQAKLPPSPLIDPEYPFQEICSDFFQLEGSNYLVTVDRLTGWPDVRKMGGHVRGARGLTMCLRELFRTFGIPEELTSDQGPEFTATETAKFLKTYDVHHRKSSVGNPHANQRAEVGVKSMKRLLRENTDGYGKLDNEKFTRAILQYRNTPLQSTGISPAMALFGRQIRDFLPVSRDHFKPSPQWINKMREREEKMTKARDVAGKKWAEHSRPLAELSVGDLVSVQNLLGNHPLRWDRTGMVVEVRQHDQYGVKIDGTGRITFRNRRNLRKFGHRESPRELPQRLPSPQNKKVMPEKDMELSSPRAMLPAQPYVEHPVSTPRHNDPPLSPPAPTQTTEFRATTPVSPANPPPSTPRSALPSQTPTTATPSRGARSALPRRVLPTGETTEKPVISRALTRIQPHNKEGDKEKPLQEKRRP